MKTRIIFLGNVTDEIKVKSMNMTQKLEIWKKQGLISENQKKDILEYERKAGRPLFLFSLLFLSCFCIGIGLIAVIASNWREIPVPVKLAADFILLGITAAGVLQTRLKEKSAWSEALLILFGLLVLASIGLFAQIYNLPSKGLQAVFFWSVIMFPLVFFSCKKVFALFWLPAFLLSGWDCLMQSEALREYMKTIARLYPGVAPFLALLAGAFVYALWSSGKRSGQPLFYAYRLWLTVALVVYVLILDMFSEDIFHPYGSGVWGYDFSNLAVWLALGLLTVLLCRLCGRKKAFFWPAAMFILLNFSLIAKILPDDGKAYELWGAVLSLAMLGLVAVYAYKTGSIRLLNLATALSAFRFFAVYLQVFGSLLSTGVGLIISGFVLLGVAVVWQKGRRRLIGKLEEV